MQKNKIYKPHLKSEKTQHLDHSSKDEKKIKNISILPHPTTLESYETIIPGITKKLCTLIQKEQDNRYELENRKISTITTLLVLGQIFFFLFAIFLVIATFIIAIQYNDFYLATVVCISGFSFLSTLSLCIFFKSTGNYRKRSKKQEIPNSKFYQSK